MTDAGEDIRRTGRRTGDSGTREAILGAARAEIKPVWDGSAFVPRLIQPLSLSYDHRVVDGALAVRFCVALKESLGDLRRTLL